MLFDAILNSICIGRSGLNRTIQSEVINQSNDKVYNEDYLGITEKGKLKWNGSFEGLRNLVMTQHISAESWTSPGGRCKLCEDNGFTTRWYSTSGSLTFGGDKSDEVKSKLLLLAQKGGRSENKVNL